MKNFITCEDVMKDYGLQAFQFIDLFKKGLQPYLQDGTKYCLSDVSILPHDECHKYNVLKKRLRSLRIRIDKAENEIKLAEEEIKEREDNSNYYYTLNDLKKRLNRLKGREKKYEGEAQIILDDPEFDSWKYFVESHDCKWNIIEQIPHLLLEKEQVIQYVKFIETKDADSSVTEPELVPASVQDPFHQPVTNDLPVDENVATFSFFKDYDNWMIGKTGSEKHVKHSIGMMRIHFLLVNEGKQFRAKSLPSANTGKVSERTSVIRTCNKALKHILEICDLKFLEEYQNRKLLCFGELCWYKNDPQNPVKWKLAP